MIKFFLIFSLILFISNANSEEIYGKAKVVDGDTIHIKSYKIRLEGIDAPEMKQKCKKEFIRISTIIGMSFTKDYACGVESKKKLINKIDNRLIKCISLSKDRYKRYLATCYKNSINLNKWMVRNGHSVAYERYSKQYVKDEDYAKKNKLGIWQSSFIRPEKWRKLN